MTLCTCTHKRTVSANECMDCHGTVLPPSSIATRERVLGTVADLVSNLLYYDRKKDEELPVGAIDKAVADDVLTVEEIVAHFRLLLIKGLLA